MKKRKNKEKGGAKKAYVENRKIFFGFSAILAIVSMVGFLEIVSKSFFQVGFEGYLDFIWLFIMGAGFIIVSKPNKIAKRKREPINELTSLVVGGLAIVAGILSIPIFKVNHPVFAAMKGVVSLIAIFFIFIETWMRRR